MESAADSGQCWEESELVMVSAIQHFSYCRRQCALIYLEQTFDENIFTMRGRVLHETVDQADNSYEQGVRTERALPIWSDSLGLVGRADIVEFRGDLPYPVEYKHGRKRGSQHDMLQLCAQAMCLEEMTGMSVPRGAIFYHGSRRRTEVIFSEHLREQVRAIVSEIRELLRSRQMPPPLRDARCRDCSLYDSCLPSAKRGESGVDLALRTLFEDGL